MLRYLRAVISPTLSPAIDQHSRVGPLTMRGSLLARVYVTWFYAGATAAVFMLAMVPFLWKSWEGSFLIAFMQLPFYMIHQVEEYQGDRFRLMVNAELAGGQDVVTPGFVLLVNLGAIWVVDLVALYLAYFIRPGLALIAIYLSLVNSIVHVMVFLTNRAYNPGLVSAIFILLPGSLLGWWILFQTRQAGFTDHVWGLGIALAIHVAIGIHILRRAKRLNSSSTANGCTAAST